MTTDAVHQDANAQLDRTLGRAITVGRAALALANAVSGSAVRGQVRSRPALTAGLSVMVGHAIWRLRDLADPTQALSRRRATTDVAVECAAMVFEALSWRARAVAPDPTWSQSYAAAVNAWLSFQLRNRSEGVVALGTGIATLLATTSGRSARTLEPGRSGQRWAQALGLQQSHAAGRAFLTVSAQARALDAARAEVLREARRLEAERERQVQFRLLHDSALQVLEAIAGDWVADEAVVRDRLEIEIAWLRRALSSQELPREALDAAFRALAQEFAAEDLVVELVCGRDLPSVSDELAAAVVDASREALRNVAKHAGVSTVRVQVVRTGSGIEIVVTDEGRGFDSRQVRFGYGIPQSIDARIAQVHGRTAIESKPRGGTTVTLWVPT